MAAVEQAVPSPDVRLVDVRKEFDELVAVDGLYRTAEDLDPGIRGKAVQAWLQDDKIETAILA